MASCESWPQPCHGHGDLIIYFISSSILISKYKNTFFKHLLDRQYCMYEHIPSPLFCMWLQHQAKILGHGYGNGYGWGSWVLAVLDIKINHMLCLGHPIHFITFHVQFIRYLTLDVLGTGWPSRLNHMAVGDLLGF